jgi:hypothetical protein
MLEIDECIKIFRERNAPSIAAHRSIEDFVCSEGRQVR